jgi:hypothetical protein
MSTMLTPEDQEASQDKTIHQNAHSEKLSQMESAYAKTHGGKVMKHSSMAKAQSRLDKKG